MNFNIPTNQRNEVKEREKKEERKTGYEKKSKSRVTGCINDFIFGIKKYAQTIFHYQLSHI